MNDTYEFYVKSKFRLSEGGFNLRKFMSNSKELLEKIDANKSIVLQSTNSTNPSNDRSSIEKENVEIAINIGQEDESYTKSKLGDGKLILN